MREILFKAKRKDNGKWEAGYYLKKIKWQRIGDEYVKDEKHYICVNMISSEDSYVDPIEVVPETLCQYTGLTDKKGNKIWENDVVKYHFGNDAAPIRFGEYQNCFDNTKTGHIGFYVDWDCKKALRKDLGYWVNMIDCNVVGNIFDNPELLEGGAK